MPAAAIIAATGIRFTELPITPEKVALAIELERNYSKNQILEMYFNQIYFGEGAYGVQAAAERYWEEHS